MRRVDAQLDEVLYIEDGAHYAKACPPCKYKTCGEEKLKFSALFAIDGNESLKRVFRSKAGETEGAPPVGIARPDGRACKTRLYVEAHDVNKFKNEVKSRSGKAVSLFYMKPPLSLTRYPESKCAGIRE